MQDARPTRAGMRPWISLAAAALLLIAAAIVAVAKVGDLGIGSLRLAERPAEPSAADAELYVTLSGGEESAPGDRAFRISEEVVVAQLESDPAVGSVRSERRGDQAVLIAGFNDSTAGEREQAAARLEQTIDGGALRARVGGEVARQLDDRAELGEELWRKLVLALPLAVLALLAAAGLSGFAAPLACAALAATGAVALLALAGEVADVSVLGVAPAVGVGIVLGGELAIRGVRAPDAPDGRPLLMLAVVAVAVLRGFALLATPLDQAASLAAGAAVAAALAAVAAILVVPAVRALTGDEPAPVRAPRLAPPPWALVALGVAILALAALALPAALWGETGPYAALDRSIGTPPLRAAADSLFEELPIAAAIAAGLAAAGMGVLVRDPVGLVLGPLSLLPAAAAVGTMVLLAETTALGRADDDGAFVETAGVAIVVCTVAAVSLARSASAMTWIAVGRRLELAPVMAGTAIGILAAAALYATDLEQAQELAVALAAGLAADLVLLRLPLQWVVNGRLRWARD